MRAARANTLEFPTLPHANAIARDASQDPSSYGSMLELAWRGSKPLSMPDGSSRSFLADADTVVIRGYASRGDLRVGFGECSGTVLPATPPSLA